MDTDGDGNEWRRGCPGGACVRVGNGTVTGCEFGRELRRLRMGAGLTLRSLAQRVAFDYSYLAQVERGDRAGSDRLAYQCDQALSAHGHLVRVFADRRGHGDA